MLIIGLGNPGKTYEQTHHNIGFMFIDSVATSFKVTFKEEKRFKCYLGEFNVNGEKHYLMKPLTYMNLSGDAVGSFVSYYKIDPKDLLVIYDDMDLPLNTRRIRKSGSAGGHNGMKSVIKVLGTQDFLRLRIGIGRSKQDNTNEEVIDYVLSKFSKKELDILSETLSLAPNIVLDLINHGADYIMNHYNK